MNLQTLKDVFFIGDEQEVDELIATFKTRCIQPSPLTVDAGNGVQERVVYNTEKDEYISQHMNHYKVCPHCGKLEKVEDIVTVEIEHRQRRREEGRRNFQNTETLCKTCLESESFVVKQQGRETYLYVDDSNTCEFHHNYGNHTYSLTTYLQDGWYHNFVSADVLYKYNEQEDNLVKIGAELIEGSAIQDLRRHYYANELTTNIYTGRHSIMPILTADFEEHRDAFAECSHCHKMQLASTLTNGKCVECNAIQIYSYHGWDGEFQCMKSESDSEEEKMFFGTEVETVGNSGNKRAVTNYQNIWHLEHDGSLGASGFEMISQPMSWKFIEEHYNDFKTMFSALVEGGQKSHDSSCCGLHIHVSRDAFVDEVAIQRAVAIVNGLSSDVETFARRRGNHYCCYDNLPEVVRQYHFTDGRRFRAGRYCAVNTEQSGHNRQTIEFRMFRGTLNPVTYMAAIQFVKNIVEIANNKLKNDIRFSDLLEGEWISQYIESRKQFVSNPEHLFSNKAIHLAGITLDAQFNRYIAGTLSLEAFTQVLRDFSAPVAMEGGVA